jgi:hypothetical protein
MLSLVEGDLGDEVAFALVLGDGAIHAPGLLHSREVFPREFSQHGWTDGHRMFYAWDLQRPHEAPHVGHVGRDRRLRGWPAYRVGHIDGEEVAGPKKLVNRGKRDVVRVHEVGKMPLAGRASRIGLDPDVLGPRANQGVFPVGLVPYRRDGDAALPGSGESAHLRRAFQAEPVADSHGVLPESDHPGRRSGHPKQIRLTP